MGSLAYVLVEDGEIKPLAFLKGLGIDLHALLEEDREVARQPKRKRHGWVFSPTQTTSAKRSHTSGLESLGDNEFNPIALD